MKLNQDWRRIRPDSRVHQRMWRDRMEMAEIHGLKPMFTRTWREEGYRYGIRCNLCQWEGPAPSARHHAKRHSDRLFDLKVIGVMERYYVIPEAK